jgi:hypothetical protein
MKVHVEEALEIERRKCNLVIHGMPETDAEQDVGCVVEMMDEVLPMDFTRNVDKVERIGRLVEGRVRPLTVMLKRLEGKKEILARAKLLKEVEKFKKMLISPDLTRKPQQKDKEFRRQLKSIRETGVMGARIKNGKVIKNDCVISVPNTIVNTKEVSTDSNLVRNALFDISALDCLFVNACGLLSKIDVLREYAVEKIYTLYE